MTDRLMAGGADATRLRLTLPDGTVVGHAQYGDPAGRPLVFLHGWPGARLQAKIIDRPARRRGLRVLAPDRPGIGDSTALACPNVAAWAAVLEAWLDALDVSAFYALGVSGGGPYALACAARMPQRIAAVGVCCGAPEPREIDGSPHLFWVYRLLRALDRANPRCLNALLTASRHYLQIVPPAWSLKPFAWLAPGPDRRALGRRTSLLTVALSTREGFRCGVDPVIADARRLQAPWGFTPGDIDVPVQFWHGLQDRNVPPGLIRPLIRRIPETREHDYPADGHYSLPLNRCDEILDHLTASRPDPS